MYWFSTHSFHFFNFKVMTKLFWLAACWLLSTTLVFSQNNSVLGNQIADESRKAKEAAAALVDLCAAVPQDPDAIAQKLEEARAAADHARDLLGKMDKNSPLYDNAKKSAARAAEHYNEAKHTAGGIALKNKVNGFCDKQKALLDEKAKKNELCDGEKGTAEDLLDTVKSRAEALARLHPCDSSAVRSELTDYLTGRHDKTKCDRLKDWIEQVFQCYDDTTYFLPRKALLLRVTGRFTGTCSFGRPEALSADPSALMAALYAPGTAEILFETLAGKYFLGNVSGPLQSPVRLTGNYRFSPGLQAGLLLSNDRWEARIGANYYRLEWEGSFPVTVFPHQSNEPNSLPRIVDGRLNATSSGVMAEAELVWYMTGGAVRPYLHGGVSVPVFSHRENKAELAGVPLEIGIKIERPSVSPFAGAGLQWAVGNYWLLNAGVSLGAMPQGDVRPALQFGAGLQF